MGRAFIRCSNCGSRFEHETTWKDILRPHAMDRRLYKCPRCGVSAFDTVEETMP